MPVFNPDEVEVASVTDEVNVSQSDDDLDLSNIIIGDDDEEEDIG
jgi:hypothetical protein